MLNDTKLSDKLFHFGLCLSPEHQITDSYRKNLLTKQEMLAALSEKLNDVLNESKIETLGDALFTIATVLGPRVESIKDVLTTVQTLGALLLMGLPDDVLGSYVLEKLLTELVGDAPK